MTSQSQDVVHRLRSQQEGAIARGGAHIGDVVQYDVDRIHISRVKLREIFERHGFADLVAPEMSTVQALGRAASRPVDRQIKLSPFSRPNADTPVAYGVYQKQNHDGESGDGFVCGARLRIVDRNDERTVVALAPENGASIDLCMEVALRIAGDANRLVHYAETTDVTAAVIKVLTGPLGGVAMRKRGGSYFIRPAESPRWQALAADLVAFNFTDLSYPMAGDVRSQRAAQHVVRSSLEDDLADLRGELDKVNDKTRDSTISARVSECDAVLAKVEMYAEILGDMQAALRTKAQSIKAQFAGQLAPDVVDPDAGAFSFDFGASA